MCRVTLNPKALEMAIMAVFVNADMVPAGVLIRDLHAEPASLHGCCTAPYRALLYRCCTAGTRAAFSGCYDACALPES